MKLIKSTTHNTHVVIYIFIIYKKVVFNNKSTYEYVILSLIVQVFIEKWAEKSKLMAIKLAMTINTLIKLTILTVYLQLK